MALPVIAFYLIFCYEPMYGALIAFQDYSPGEGLIGTHWVGLKHFFDFLTSPDIGRLFKNTLTISIANLIFGFTAPIILALLLNEVRGLGFKRLCQTISYLPHFISIVVICGLIMNFTHGNGVISTLLSPFIGKNVNMLTRTEMFVPIYVISDIWQGVGWGSIIYIAAIAGIDPGLYEAARIDGAGRWRQTLNVTLPGIAPTMIILFILRIGGLLGVGHEKIILLYSPLIYETSDVIASYIYRLAFTTASEHWSYTTAVGLFNSLLNFALLILANYLCKRVSGSGLW
jgi:putative aldouronate transport system permease protein